jgi:coenzyme Q-binding protein COQ10
MPLVEVTEIVDAPVQRLWDAVNDVESYPRLMEHVRSVEVRECGLNYKLLAWEVELQGCIMRWTERAEAYPERFRIDYRQVEGNMAEFEGYWQLQPLTDDTSQVLLSIKFEIGIPMLSEMLNPIAERAVRENSLQMLRSLSAEAVQKKDSADAR